MDLNTYIADRARRDQLVKSTGIDPGYLWQIATGWRHKRPSPELARRIAAATNDVVRLDDLRPDIWPPEAKADQRHVA